LQPPHAAPHPDTSFSGAEWATAWDAWNRGLAATHAALGFLGFDGIDWDLEGNDDQTSPFNAFTPACVELVGTMSQAMKAAGYIVTMVPPESYFDPSTSAVDLDLRHAYPEWHQEFLYHGHNAYALILAKYGNWTDAGAGSDGGPDGPGASSDGGGGRWQTFDFVDIQIYESWSHAAFAIDQQGMPAEDYLAQYVQRLTDGWTVDFGADPSLGLPTQVRSPLPLPAPRPVLLSCGVKGEGHCLL
jgi:hypothetical protein